MSKRHAINVAYMFIFMWVCECVIVWVCEYVIVYVFVDESFEFSLDSFMFLTDALGKIKPSKYFVLHRMLFELIFLN